LIARRREAAARAALVLAEAAATDALTGLANRRLLKDRLDQAMNRADRSGRAIAVLFCDIDRFKAVNDRFGHHVGDRLLVELASRLSGCLRPKDTLARVSGDEFVILCEDLTDTAQAEEVATRVLAAVAEPFSVEGGGQGLVLGMSIGMALAGTDHDSPEGALVRADAAMYRAKRRGGNQQVNAAYLSLAEVDRDRGIDAGLPTRSAPASSTWSTSRSWTRRRNAGRGWRRCCVGATTGWVRSLHRRSSRAPNVVASPSRSRGGSCGPLVVTANAGGSRATSMRPPSCA
jgi:diguanylate cyclase (GGDEF)-like protein